MSEFFLCKKKKGWGGGVARGRRYTALLSVTPPLGPSPHIRRAAKRQSNRRSACDATCARRRNDAHSQRPAEIPHLFSHMLKMHLIDGGEIRSLWYMHLAGLSEVEGSGIKRVAGALSVYISQVSAGTCPRFVLWVSFIKWRNERDV